MTDVTKNPLIWVYDDMNYGLHTQPAVDIIKSLIPTFRDPAYDVPAPYKKEFEQWMASIPNMSKITSGDHLEAMIWNPEDRPVQMSPRLRFSKPDLHPHIPDRIEPKSYKWQEEMSEL
jgi:hypothetical protein